MEAEDKAVREPRKYSCEEIMAMRNAIGMTYAWNCDLGTKALARDTELQLRTYMINGSDPAEVLVYSQKVRRLLDEREETEREMLRLGGADC